MRLKIVLIIVACLFLVPATVTEEQEVREACVNPEMAGHLRNMILEGIDQAMRNRIALLFDIWVKDSVDEPRRAIEGVNAAISAYVRSRNNALKWNPPACAISGSVPKYVPPKQ